jgi:hypothetical protein
LNIKKHAEQTIKHKCSWKLKIHAYVPGWQENKWESNILTSDYNESIIC